MLFTSLFFLAKSWQSRFTMYYFVPAINSIGWQSLFITSKRYMYAWQMYGVTGLEGDNDSLGGRSQMKWALMQNSKPTLHGLMSLFSINDCQCLYQNEWILTFDAVVQNHVKALFDADRGEASVTGGHLYKVAKFDDTAVGILIQQMQERQVRGCRNFMKVTISLWFEGLQSWQNQFTTSFDVQFTHDLKWIVILPANIHIMSQS